MADAGAGAVLWAWHLTRPARAFTGSATATVAGTALRFAPPDVLAARTERGRTSRAGIEQLVVMAMLGGLLWAAASRHRRSVQDVVLRTAVVYDGSDDAGMHRPGEAR